MANLNKIRSIAVIGLGQMGGSFALALRKHLPEIQVLGYSPIAEERELAVKIGAVHSAVSNPNEAIKQADFVMLALPICPLIDFVKDNVQNFKTDAIISDLSSVKHSIELKLSPLLKANGLNFVGAHPMAGNEKSGLAHASADLYLNNTCFICPEGKNDESVDITNTIWQQIGSKTITIPAQQHDEVLAKTSHALHLVSNAVTHVAMEDKIRDTAMLSCAGSFRDISRISASNPKMWRSICEHNKDAIIHALSEIRQESEILEKLLAQENWTKLESYLEEGKDLRDSWWDFHQNKEQ